MRERNWKAVGVAAGLAVAAALSVAACGSDEGSPQPKAEVAPFSPGTAEQLASASDQVAEELEAGDTCAAAHSADDLSAAVSEADIPAVIRPEIEAAARQLVDEINCEPIVEKKKKEKDEEKKHREDRGDESTGSGPGPPGHGGEPPGQAKKHGEEG
jgi:hypothetical protein